ncbi:DUF6879 family protein [Nocardia crassostreae]|uniref:DUF6879 family protein n=1 Tax=Nocardia crassostreae TaxID=53428 RepID=UPI00083105B4|nr:DUF6879 family protein [Nocardia crassostreae]
MELRQNNPWPDLFGEARKSVFHLEVRDTYAVPSESEPFRRFLAGEPRRPDEGWEAWSSLIGACRSRGVTVSRVRVVTVPHSDYQRWLLTETPDNIAAGEDIRYLPRHLVGPDQAPADDFWLLDDVKVAFNLVDEEGRPAGAAVTTDPDIVAYCHRSKERLWSMATPFGRYYDTSVTDPQ